MMAERARCVHRAARRHRHLRGTVRGVDAGASSATTTSRSACSNVDGYLRRRCSRSCAHAIERGFVSARSARHALLRRAHDPDALLDALDAAAQRDSAPDDSAPHLTARRAQRRQTAASSVSPVRMRTTCSTVRDEDLAVADLAGLGRLDDRLDAALDVARPSPPPRSSPWAGSRPRTRRRGTARCGPSGGRSP